MSIKHLTFAFALVAAAASRPAFAQFPYYYGQYHHASTVEEGAANGMANVIQSAGAANLLNSQAARNYEEARSRDLDNRLKATNTYFEMRKMNQEYRAAERGPKPTSEQMFRLAKERAPSRLGPNDLDPLTGQISWPVILEDEAYKEYRERLDSLFATRARYHGQIGADQYLELQRTAKALDAELKTRIKDYPPGDYVKAKGILDSLAYEASLTRG
jgi:hypothetical protein